MKFALLAVFATLAAQGYAVFTVNTPASVVQCEPILLSWQDGTAPYYLSIIPGGQPTAAALKSFPTMSSTQYTWNVDIPAGTSITIALRDSSGVQVFSDAVTIASSSDTSCVNSSVSEGATGSSTGAAAPTNTGSSTGSGSGASPSPSSASVLSHPNPSATSASASGSTSSSLAGTGSSSATRPSNSGSAASASSGSGGATRGSSMDAVGLAGLIGLIGAALL